MLAISKSEGMCLECDLRVDTENNDCYTCFGSVVDPKNPGKIERVNGLNLKGKSNFDVKCFNIQGRKEFTVIPSGLKFFFRNLESINVIDTAIDEITDTDLEGLDKIDKEKIYVGTTTASTTTTTTTQSPREIIEDILDKCSDAKLKEIVDYYKGVEHCV